MIMNTRASPNNKKRATQSRSPLPARRATSLVGDTTTKTKLYRIPKLSNSATVQKGEAHAFPSLPNVVTLVSPKCSHPVQSLRPRRVKTKQATHLPYRYHFLHCAPTNSKKLTRRIQQSLRHAPSPSLALHLNRNKRHKAQNKQNFSLQNPPRKIWIIERLTWQHPVIHAGHSLAGKQCVSSVFFSSSLRFWLRSTSHCTSLPPLLFPSLAPTAHMERWNARCPIELVEMNGDAIVDRSYDTPLVVGSSLCHCT